MFGEKYTSRGHILRFCTTALRGRRAPPSQSDGLGGPSYKFPQSRIRDVVYLPRTPNDSRAPLSDVRLHSFV